MKMITIPQPQLEALQKNARRAELHRPPHWAVDPPTVEDLVEVLTNRVVSLRARNLETEVEIQLGSVVVAETDGGGAEVREALGRLKVMVGQQRAAVTLARLQRLVDVMRHKTDQGYKLRALLWSLWNGKPTSLNAVCGLDHQLRQDLCDLILAWGYGSGDWEFFYNAMKAASSAGLWEWFCEAGDGRCGECGRE